MFFLSLDLEIVNSTFPVEYHCISLYIDFSDIGFDQDSARLEAQTFELTLCILIHKLPTAKISNKINKFTYSLPMYLQSNSIPKFAIRRWGWCQQTSFHNFDYPSS